MNATTNTGELVLQHLGCKYPIVQSPMGWIARSQLASAVSNSGGLGMIETSSGEVDNCMVEIDKMNEMGVKAFGVNLPLMLLRDPRMMEELVKRKLRFVTTSAGSPAKLLPTLRAQGLIVYHSVANMTLAQKAVDAGVDGLVVEGHEGGGFKNKTGVSTLVLVHAVRAKFPHIPIIAAGGIASGTAMAAAMVAGADAVQMGTRFVASVESPVHDNYKNAIVESGSDDTIVVNQEGMVAMRVINTEKAQEIGIGPMGDETMNKIQDLYFKGDLGISVALAGQSAETIKEILPVSTIFDNILSEVRTALSQTQQRIANLAD